MTDDGNGWHTLLHLRYDLAYEPSKSIWDKQIENAHAEMAVKEMHSLINKLCGNLPTDSGENDEMENWTSEAKSIWETLKVCVHFCNMFSHN